MSAKFLLWTGFLCMISGASFALDVKGIEDFVEATQFKYQKVRDEI